MFDNLRARLAQLIAPKVAMTDSDVSDTVGNTATQVALAELRASYDEANRQQLTRLKRRLSEELALMLADLENNRRPVISAYDASYSAEKLGREVGDSSPLHRFAKEATEALKIISVADLDFPTMRERCIDMMRVLVQDFSTLTSTQ